MATEHGSPVTGRISRSFEVLLYDIFNLDLLPATMAYILESPSKAAPKINNRTS